MQARKPVLSSALMADSSMTKYDDNHSESDDLHLESGHSSLVKVLVMILLAAAVAIGVAMLIMIQPQDLTDIGGYELTMKTEPSWDMQTILKNAIDRKQPLTLTERHINQWLGRALVTKQGGLFAGLISLDRVWVRLENGRAEVIMVRRIIGQPFTVSMFLKIEQTQGPKGMLTQVHMHGGPYHENLPQPLCGGRFGSLAVPQGFLLLVKPAYEKLATLFSEEIHLGFEEMARIQIMKGRLILDPRNPVDDPSFIAPDVPRTF
jgi:hypothetical protein